VSGDWYLVTRELFVAVANIHRVACRPEACGKILAIMWNLACRFQDVWLDVHVIKDGGVERAIDTVSNVVQEA
jgi:hypothetical protein